MEKLANRQFQAMPSELHAAAAWPRIWHGNPAHWHVDRATAAGLGFDAILLPGTGYLDHPERLDELGAGVSGGPSLLLGLSLDKLDIAHPLLSLSGADYSLSRATGQFPVDPRRPATPKGRATLRRLSPEVEAWWRNSLRKCRRAGVKGLVVEIDSEIACQLAGKLRGILDGPFIAALRSPGDALLKAAAGAGFSAVTTSLPWWDGRAPWLMVERERLMAAAAPLAPVALPDSQLPEIGHRRARLIAAAVTGAGWIMPAGFENGLEEEVRWLNQHFAEAGRAQLQGLRALPNDRGLLLLAHEDGALLAAFNSSDHEIAGVPDSIPGLNAAEIVPVFSGDALLHPGEAALYRIQKASVTTREPSVRAVETASAADLRIVIDRIAPAIDGGRYAVKRLIGDTPQVSANIFMDGHAHLAARLCVKVPGNGAWRYYPMSHLGNDRWIAEMPLRSLGDHVFQIEAWVDDWGSFRSDLGKKIDANSVIAADLADGRAIVSVHAAQHKGQKRKPFDELLARLETTDELALADILRSPRSDEILARSDHRPFMTRSFRQLVRAERRAAHFSSWYELFPRSQTDDPARHGTFRDVIARLPAIRAMGFDTLYFPPIHPIGRTNRKGANNSLQAAPDEPGSPYAIGGEAGGHDALHPELGSFDDFRDLISAAHDHGLEIALDFAIQCAPDHPWLRVHPEWFNWRSDGTVKYAENPPKKYQDIVNVDFYRDGAVPELWLALRDIVLFWVWHGVKCFRVDNPHTKPLPFWHWLIEEVTARHPDVIFLSEAFTRPAVMYHLAKVGFSQSYTYFTWRNTKRELTDYFTELATTEVKDYFRPHLFVNTPDINPMFLQQSGRGGFLIRACLGATLSGLFGVYSGFELCESAPLPGKEEYLDSEKYQIRIRDWQQPGNIVSEITTLNRLRRYHPALQTHLNTVFYNAFNDQILYFGKRLPGDGDMILVAVNLDPHGTQSADIEVPLWEFGCDDGAAVEVEDLLRDSRFVWRGKVQHVSLSPEMPYAIWRIRPRGEA